MSGTVIRNKDDCSRLFLDTDDDRICGKASPSYLYEPGVAFRIAEAQPEYRCIVILRDPVERAYYLLAIPNECGR